MLSFNITNNLFKFRSKLIVLFLIKVCNINYYITTYRLYKSFYLLIYKELSKKLIAYSKSKLLKGAERKIRDEGRKAAKKAQKILSKGCFQKALATS